MTLQIPTPLSSPTLKLGKHAHAHLKQEEPEGHDQMEGMPNLGTHLISEEWATGFFKSSRRDFISRAKMLRWADRISPPDWKQLGKDGMQKFKSAMHSTASCTDQRNHPSSQPATQVTWWPKHSSLRIHCSPVAPSSHVERKMNKRLIRHRTDSTTSSL